MYKKLLDDVIILDKNMLLTKICKVDSLGSKPHEIAHDVPGIPIWHETTS